MANIKTVILNNRGDFLGDFIIRVSWKTIKEEKNTGYCLNITTLAYPIDENFTRLWKEMKIKMLEHYGIK